MPWLVPSTACNTHVSVASALCSVQCLAARLALTTCSAASGLRTPDCAYDLLVTCVFCLLVCVLQCLAARLALTT